MFWNARFPETRAGPGPKPGPGFGNGAGTFEEATTLRVQCLMMMPIHQNNSRMASIASGNSLNALNERWIFLFYWLFHFYGRNTKADQALNEKSEPITTDDPIELTMNLHQSIQPIGNNYIFAKKGNTPCSGRIYSYIPSLTFDSQQVRRITKYTMPLATSCILIKEQQVLNSPYRLSPLHWGRRKTMCVVCLQRACGAPLAPLRGIPHAAFSEAAPFLTRSLARSLAR